MKNRLIIIFSLVFVLLVAIGTVSAEDVDSSDVVGAGIDENIGVDDSTDNLSSTNSNEVVGASEIYVNDSAGPSGNGSKTNPFKYLDGALDVANNGDTIYIASGIYSYWGQIYIEKEVTLTTYGDNPVIFDGENNNRIFYVTAANVEIRGITFVNGCEKTAIAGSIYWKGANGTLANCTFINSTSKMMGSAVCFKVDVGVLANCTFINSTVTSGGNGGAVYLEGNNNILSNCTFINSTSTVDGKTGGGGAIYWLAGNGVLANCTFINSTCTCTVQNRAGGAIYASARNITCFNCTFINSTANNGNGGAIYYQVGGSAIISSVFINSKASIEGNAIYTTWNGDTNIIDCIFINSSGSNYDICSAVGAVADYNWFENTYYNRTVAPKTYKTTVSKWLYLKSDANSNTLNPGESITVNYDLYVYDNSTGESSPYDASNMPAMTFEVSSQYGLTNVTSIELVKGHASLLFTSLGTENDLKIMNSTFWLRQANSIYVNGSVATSGDGSKNNPFKTLSEAINMADDGAVIYIASGTYVGDGLNAGLKIDKEVTLKTYGGEPVIFDGEGSNSIFQVISDNVEISNITFRNASNYYGSIFWIGSNGSLFNCSFMNMDAMNSGGAVYWYGHNGCLSDCSFINSTSLVGSNGGAVYWGGDNGSLANCTFINSTVLGGCGGAVYWNGDNGSLANCSFTNSFALIVGSAVYWYGNNGTLFNSTFSNNGGLIRDIYAHTDLNVLNCTFADAVLTLEVSGDIVAGENETINGTLDKNTNMNHIFELFRDSEVWAIVEMNNNAFSYVYDNAQSGTYNMTLSNVDSKGNIYGNISPKARFVISKAVPEVTIENPEVIRGEDLIIDVPADATCDVIVTIDGDMHILTPNGGKALFNTTDLIPNDYDVFINFTGDNKYENLSFTSNITVLYELIIDAPEFVKYYGGSEKFNLTITTAKGDPIEGQLVFITINGVEYNRTTDKDGKAYLNIDLSPGYYPVTVKAKSIVENSSVSILTTVNGTDVVKTYRNATQYFATFRDSEGNCLKKGTNITYNINGVFYNRTVDDNGLARLNINLGAGTYILTAYNPVTGELSSNNITVLSQIIDNRDLVKYYKNDTQYVVRVTGEDGKVVGAGEKVIFNINGMLYERYTNETGHAVININLSPGSYIVTAMYGSSMSSNNITVLPTIITEDLTKKYGTPDQFKAKVVDKTGKILAGVDVKFNINGIIYTRPTDVNGTAYLNINLGAGKYIITSMYDDSAVSNNITVID